MNCGLFAASCVTITYQRFTYTSLVFVDLATDVSKQVRYAAAAVPGRVLLQVYTLLMCACCFVADLKISRCISLATASG